METAQLFSSILGECTSYQIAGTLTKDGSSTITEEITESLLKVSPPCSPCEGHVQGGCIPLSNHRLHVPEEVETAPELVHLLLVAHS